LLIPGQWIRGAALVGKRLERLVTGADRKSSLFQDIDEGFPPVRPHRPVDFLRDRGYMISVVAPGVGPFGVQS
jgi:hypothetical protein